MKRLQKKIVFITGATSGIGKSCAYRLASEGAAIIITGRRKDRLAEIEKEIIKKYNVPVLSIELDVRRHKDVKNAVASLPDNWKDIDILINNAGLARGMGKLQEGVIEEWDEMVDTNVKGFLYVSREVLPIMSKRGSGHVINIGSIAGHEVYPNGNVYCATKFAVDALSRAMRMDIVDRGVKVTAISPGMVKTEFAEVRFSGNMEKAENFYKGIDPLTPDDIADAVLYCLTCPSNLVVNEMILTPVYQASATLAIRK